MLTELRKTININADHLNKELETIVSKTIVSKTIVIKNR